MSPSTRRIAIRRLPRDACLAALWVLRGPDLADHRPWQTGIAGYDYATCLLTELGSGGVLVTGQAGDHCLQQVLRGMGNLIDRAVECLFVGR